MRMQARLFTKGVADAARDARAVITTAGTDSGVAKLAAAALQTMSIRQPVIGVAPFRKVLGGFELLGDQVGQFWPEWASWRRHSWPSRAPHCPHLKVWGCRLHSGEKARHLRPPQAAMALQSNSDRAAVCGL